MEDSGSGAPAEQSPAAPAEQAKRPADRPVTPEMLARYWHTEQVRIASRFGQTVDAERWEDLHDDRRALLEAVAGSALMRFFGDRVEGPFGPFVTSAEIEEVLKPEEGQPDG